MTTSSAAASSREQHREREFYRYFDPLLGSQHAQFPFPLCDLNKPAAAGAHQPRSSPDTALTAFCQLGALRLAARRCMIFSFDSQYAYVLAEATRTLSLQDDADHGDSDALWLGHAVLPRGFSVCEHTVNIPEANKGSNRDHRNAGAVHVINDLRDDVRFCDRPFVVDGPKARFYAGVPLTTSKGVRIGAYCVLDDRPRDGISQKDVAFLEQMAQTVMKHLDNVRARSELSRGSQMLVSLDKFFELTSTDVARRRKRRGAGEVMSVSKSPLLSGRSSPLLNRSTPAPGKHATGNAKTGSPIRTTVPAHRHGMEGQVESDIQRNFETAAVLIKEAAEADGVVFLDATAGTAREGRSSPSTSPEEHESASSVGDDASPDGSQHLSGLPAYQATPERTCAVLGQSVGSSKSVANTPYPLISTKFLNSLLRRYPHGKVWNFGSDDEPVYDSVSDSGTTNDVASGNTSRTESDDDRKKREAKRRRETRLLREALPGVHALCLVSLWDPIREKFYAGAVVWSTSPSRIFSTQGELSYARAFCEVVTSNISRLEARKLNEMKSHFISSVSHELRSPLHGIIGSVDLMQEQKMVDWSIIRQIEKCSITLLDVIDHLLDYSKINNLAATTKRRGREQNVSGTRKMSSDYAAMARPGQAKAQSLADATEEIADTVYYSHCYSLMSQQRGRVGFILETSVECSNFRDIPKGAWKRICMNVISNALKYTTEGHIMVSLRDSVDDQGNQMAMFVVKDTGRGMAPEFLKNRLFRAFSQEDSLSIGTGLGMSLVAKLVKGLHGIIDVQSTKHAGTTVTVTIPVKPSGSNRLRTLGSTPFPGLTFRFLESKTPPALATQPLREAQMAALERTCAQLGLTAASEHSDLDLVFEADLPNVLLEHAGGTGKMADAVIVLCDTFVSALHVRNGISAHALWTAVECIAQPFGRNRLIEAIALTRKDHPHRNHAGLDASASFVSPATDYVREATDSATLTSLAYTTEGPPNQAATQEVSLQLSRLQLSQAAAVSPPTESSRKGSASSNEVMFSGKMAPRSIPGQQGNHHHTDASLSDQPRLSLLLVDDNHINLRLLKTYANRNQHPWLAAINGMDAMQIYKACALSLQTFNNPQYQSEPPASMALSASRPDVVFMDINMPVMDGYEATRCIRTFEREQNLEPTIIVALTGLGSSEAEAVALNSGIDIFRTKPVRPRDMKELLDEINEQQAARKLV